MLAYLITSTQHTDGLKRHVLCVAHGREDAKQQAHRTLLYSPDRYTVTPLTVSDEEVTFALGNVQVV